MEIIDQNNPKQDNEWHKYQDEWKKRHRRGKVFGGILLVGAGVLLLAKQSGVEFPEWFFTWKVLLIVIGIYMGVKHAFKSFGWLIPIAIGSAFLLQDFYPELNTRHFFWPIFFIIVGLVMIFRPRRNHDHYHRKWEKKFRNKWDRHYCNEGPAMTSSEDGIEVSAVFGSVKKNIISKDFKGGEINCVFGGAMINLTQADISGKAVLEINCVFGGTKLYVPQNWQVQAGELVSVMGGIEDKRGSHGAVNSDKILVLKGNAVFGGIEILN